MNFERKHIEKEEVEEVSGPRQQNRIGKFHIPSDMIDNNFDCVLEIMKHCVIIRAEFLYCDHRVKYVAYSNKFEIHPKMIIPPEYEWCFDENEVYAKEIK